jgi:hypothetical protein
MWNIKCKDTNQELGEMNRLEKKPIGNVQANRYAASEDFCRVFNEKSDSLYLLSFLLTADHSKAEQCFVAGLGDSFHSKQVFKDWAHSWAKLTVVRNAIAALQPRPGHISPSLHDMIPAESSRLSNVGDCELYSVLALPDFVRFVFVLSVLEQCTDLDCVLLLRCSPKQIQRARIRALELIAEPDVQSSAATRSTTLSETVPSTPATNEIVHFNSARCHRSSPETKREEITPGVHSHAPRVSTSSVATWQ